jgi:HAD superfamily hydrolase (TIGR01490 family)
MGIISSENKKKGISYIVFFDLDHTLVNANSGKLLVKVAYEKRIMTLTGIIKALWLSFLYNLNLKNTENIISEMVKWLAGVPQSTVSELSSEVFKKHLLTSIPEEVNSEIKMHKDKNAAIVILSSALLPICRKVADYLDLDDVICTELEVEGNCFTGRPSGKICFGNEKLFRLKKYCEKINSKISDAWYYGDSISDLPVLTIVGYPVCINPDRQLMKKAREKNWIIFNWK